MRAWRAMKVIGFVSLFVALIVLWAGTYRRDLVGQYWGRWGHWELHSTRGVVGVVYCPSKTAWPDWMMGFRCERHAYRPSGFHLLGFRFSRHDHTTVNVDAITLAHTYVGVPYWFLVMLLVFRFWRYVRRRGRDATPGFEVKVPTASGHRRGADD